MASKKKEAWLILGDQLFEPKRLKKSAPDALKVFMFEDYELCTHYRYHRHKLVLFLASMRNFKTEVEVLGFEVHYEALEGSRAGQKKPLPFEKKFIAALKKEGIEKIHFFEISDRFFEARITDALQASGIAGIAHPSPGFLTPRSEFSAYLAASKKPFMKTFYERQRRRLGVLVDRKGDPEGGQFSFDEDNRERLPTQVKIPALPKVDRDSSTQEVIPVVDSLFSDHPGKASEFWLPTTRKGAKSWLKHFITHRLKEFGPYEDALSLRDPFLFHSVLTPFLNTGLLEPSEVVEAVLNAYDQSKLPLNSVEGFIRQVMGWREFIFGMDRHFGEKQWNLNHWNHERRLTHHWYDATTGLPPLDEVIRKLQRYAYSHHIERLMIAGNLMLTCEIHPHEAYRWFMEMYVDSADWVMGPNVFGMGIFSDGGVFATKPYLCGSNYWLKMGDYAKGDWCDIADGLYWSFIAKHQKEFIKNARMATIARSLDRMGAERKQKIFKAAETFKARVTEG